MSSNDGANISYSDANYRSLMAELKALTTFGAVTAWDLRARDELSKLAAVIQQLEDEITRQKQVLLDAQQAHAEKSPVGRLFGGNKAEKEAAKKIELYEGYVEKLGALADDLQAAIDMSPSSAEEQKQLLKELRLRKKELQAQKKELSTAMKDIRENARQMGVHAGRGFLGVYNSKLASYERRKIRYEREAALKPNENLKASLERQLLQLEREILWVEKLAE